MKKGLTEIICVADRSGSMASICTDAIGSFNTFLEDQQAFPGECLFTYTQFDGVYEIIHSGISIQKITPLDKTTYVPRGATALLDAIGKTIDAVGNRLANTPEDQRPERILFVILTDGCENASKMYTRSQIFDKITHQRDVYNWQFVFLAAGQDAFDEATSIGILPGHTYCYAAGNAGAHVQSMCDMAAMATAYRQTGDVNLPPSPDIQKP